MESAIQLSESVGTSKACASLGVSRASLHRYVRGKSFPGDDIAPRSKGSCIRISHRALSEKEESKVLEYLHSESFVDKSPAEVFAILPDRKTYICSKRTMYRILERNKEVVERRDQARHIEYARPELLANRPNELWSWDITKLKGPTKWTYYYLYTIIDVFSRYVVGWMIAYKESAELAKRLISDTVAKQGIVEG